MLPFENMVADLFVGNYAWPSKMTLYSDGIALFEGNCLVKKIAFKNYGASLTCYNYWWCTDGSKDEDKFDQLEYLAHLINEHFCQQYTIYSKINRSETSYTSMGLDVIQYHSCQAYVEMSRNP